MHLHSMAVFVLVSLALEQAEFVVGGDEDVYLVYGTPGSRQGYAGLYGGNFKPNEPPNNLNLKQTQIYSASHLLTSLRGFSVTGLSYDPMSKKILMQLSNNLAASLARIDPCKNGWVEKEDFNFFGFNRLHTGPFALYDSDIYYVSQASHLEDQSVVITLKIRKVTGCQDKKNTFMMRNGYDDRNCSMEVAKVMEEVVYTHENLDPEYVPDFGNEVETVGSSLIVVKHENKLHFLVQVAKPLYSSSNQIQEYSLRLYEAAEGAESKLLHETPVPIKWTNHIINNMGDISYKDGLLCWSAFESMFCGKWNKVGNIAEVREVIKPGDAARVCNVTSSRLQKYQNIVSGIEIASAKDQINIIFGCWASWSGHGGAGYLTANSHLSNVQMKKILDKEGPILAGSLAIIDACPTSSRREVDFEDFL